MLIIREKLSQTFIFPLKDSSTSTVHIFSSVPDSNYPQIRCRGGGYTHTHTHSSSCPELVTWPYHISTGKPQLLDTTDANRVPGGGVGGGGVVVLAMRLLAAAAALFGKNSISPLQFACLYGWISSKSVSTKLPDDDDGQNPI